MSDILDKIVAVKRDEISLARRKRDLASVRRDAEQLGGQRDFVGALGKKIAAGQAGEDIVTHGQTPQSCGMTVRVGRRGGKLINRRSSWVGVALHPVARRGLPAPRGLRVSCGPSRGQRTRQSPRRHGSRLIPSVVLLSGVNAAQIQDAHDEHGLTTGCFAVVDNTPRGPAMGRRVVHNQAPWTTLHRSSSTSLQYGEVA